MSIRQLSAIHERKCDNCGKVVLFDQLAISEADKEETLKWYLIAKDVANDNGERVGVSIHACSKDCAHQAIMGDKLRLPPSPPPTIFRGKSPEVN